MKYDQIRLRTAVSTIVIEPPEVIVPDNYHSPSGITMEIRVAYKDEREVVLTMQQQMGTNPKTVTISANAARFLFSVPILKHLGIPLTDQEHPQRATP